MKTEKPDFIRARHIQREYGISESTARRWGKTGEFPPLIKLGPRVSGWWRADIERYIAERSGQA